MRYKIKKGNNYANKTWKFPFTFRRKINIDITIDKDSLIYEHSNKEDQIRTNKLYGISDSFYHRFDSVRIGWFTYQKFIYIVMYTYSNREHKTTILYRQSIYSSQVIHMNFDIEIHKNKYIIKNDYIQYSAERTSKYPLWMPRYFCNPFFGNDETGLVTNKDIQMKIVTGKPIYKSKFSRI